MNDELMRPTTDADIVKFWQRAADAKCPRWSEDENAMSMTGVRVMLREIDRLREQVAGLEKERDAAVKAMDDNWVTHQQIIASRSQLAAAHERIAELEKEDTNLRLRLGDSFEREMYAHSENNCLKAEYARYDERLAAAHERIGVLEKENDGLRHPPTAIICKCCNSLAFARRGDVHCEECRDAATAQPTKETI